MEAVRHLPFWLLQKANSRLLHLANKAIAKGTELVVPAVLVAISVASATLTPDVRLTVSPKHGVARHPYIGAAAVASTIRVPKPKPEVTSPAGVLRGRV